MQTVNPNLLVQHYPTYLDENARIFELSFLDSVGSVGRK